MASWRLWVSRIWLQCTHVVFAFPTSTAFLLSGNRALTEDEEGLFFSHSKHDDITSVIIASHTLATVSEDEIFILVIATVMTAIVLLEFEEMRHSLFSSGSKRPKLRAAMLPPAAEGLAEDGTHTNDKTESRRVSNNVMPGLFGFFDSKALFFADNCSNCVFYFFQPKKHPD